MTHVATIGAYGAEFDTDARPAPAPRSGQTASGYGSRIPTNWQVRYNGRWYRVYCRIYSNAGTCYLQTVAGSVIVHNITEATPRGLQS